MQPLLQPGPLRDALASLSEHSRGNDPDNPFTAATLQARIGVSPLVAVERLDAIARAGLAERVIGTNPPEYRITGRGQKRLGQGA